ncbi:hypothetical protein ACFQLX_14300 [Streptomyces polyrhachis]|uniref:Uncharacterized protein n=1 Tax=Streptomyces polyrhachis TaxID=1282885 RepID=A0ABW2GJV8_9ACTN
MRVELAGGVTVDGHSVWVDGASGPARWGNGAVAAAGAAAAVGPGDAPEGGVRAALAELGRLVAAGGVVAAGAGVELGAGFRSARLAGGRGEPRDAVFAALRVLGAEGAGRLGERGAVLVALFGPGATKRVGAAAAAAVREERWGAVRLAAAASDVLGPEQLEGVLALSAPAGVDPVGEVLPSVLAAQLRQVLEAVPAARRADLLLDLWERVLARHARARRRVRLLATQARQGRQEALRERRKRYEEDVFLADFTAGRDRRTPASVGAAARWVPRDHALHAVLHRLVDDARAATVLLDTAVAVTDHGVAEGLRRMEPMLALVGDRFGDQAVYQANRRIPGLVGLPARPGVQVRELVGLLRSPRRGEARFEAAVRQRLAHARDYAVLVGEELVEQVQELPTRIVHDWAAATMRHWREAAGPPAGRDPADAPAPPPWLARWFGPTTPLVERLGAPDGGEVVGDLLWYVELLDAQARLYGHERAVPAQDVDWLDPDPPAAGDPLTPRLDSVALAAAATAQLVSFGARPPKGVRSWDGLTAGLLAAIDVSAALDGEFAVPSALAAVDGAVLPGTGTRVRFAHGVRTLADWAAYMGNCIAGPHYADRARAGHCGLLALCDEHGTVLANAELRPMRPAARGWRVEEVAGRFNNSPDPELVRLFRAWVGTLPGAEPPRPGPREEERPPRRRVSPPVHEVAGPALTALLTPATVPAALAELAATAPESALVRLRRTDTAALTASCRRVIGEGGLIGLWEATSHRPLTDAIGRLDPVLRERYAGLESLTGDAPLPRSLRRLVRAPEVGAAYRLETAARRIRAVLGQLVCADDPLLAAALNRRVTVPLLCALTATATLRVPARELAEVAPPRAVTVPGYPASTLSDPSGPWRRALAGVCELGADPDAFWDRVAAGGLGVRRSWLGGGGWPALWARAQG